MHMILAILTLFATSTAQLKTLKNSLDPTSLTEQLAFYQLYPDTPQGIAALKRAWQLLGSSKQTHLTFPDMDLKPLIALVNRQPLDPAPKLPIETLDLIETISNSLKNRELKGFHLWDKEDAMNLSSSDIDLARALLLHQFDDKVEIRRYEATLDLMALQIKARLKKSASHEEKIRAINQFIFHEMGYRFPPHSLWVDDVDIYTFLPAVMDSRKGVCLGVSILYLCLAQRLDLPLEIVTPPGHIYIRYNENLNIETTARGIHLPSKAYLGIHTKTLQTRTLKEVIGLNFVNQAAVCWQKQDYTLAIDLYEKAQSYLPDDRLLKMLLGYNYLFTNQTKKGKALLKEISDTPLEGSITLEPTPEDFLNRKIDAEGIKIIFLHVDETKASIEDKQQKLQTILKRYPKFRDGWFHLAITHLQLGNNKEGIKALETYHKLDPSNPTVEYYLSQLHLSRFNPKTAWKHLQIAETLTKSQGHHPPALTELRHALRSIYPLTNE